VRCKHGLGRLRGAHPPPAHSSIACDRTADRRGRGAADSTVISVFAIVILSVLGLLFKSNHHELVGGDDDPDNGPAVAATVFIAVAVYAVCLRSSSCEGPLPGSRPSSKATCSTGNGDGKC
jgi:ribonuclease kappa